MRKGIKIRIYPDKEQEELLLSYCKDYHNTKNFLVAKFKDNLPNVGKRNIIGYKDKDLLSEYESTYNCKTEMPTRCIRGAIEDYVSGVRKFYQKISSKPPKFHKYDPNKQSFYIVDVLYKISNCHIPMPINRNFVKQYKTISKKIPINKKICYERTFNILKRCTFSLPKREMVYLRML